MQRRRRAWNQFGRLRPGFESGGAKEPGAQGHQVVVDREALTAWLATHENAEGRSEAVSVYVVSEALDVAQR